MRKIILTSLFAFGLLTTQAQQWVDLGFKYGIGLSHLYNSNIFNDKGINQEFSFGQSIGGKFGFNLHEYHEITFDFMSSNMGYEYTFFNTEPNETKTMTMRGIDMGLFYRHNKNGSYFEIGPQLSRIKSVRESHSGMSGGENTTENFEDQYFSAVLGFGGYLIGTENIGLTMGFRFSYSFQDVLSEAGGKNQTSYYPANSASTQTNYDSYAATHPVSLLFIAEINFDFAYIARASCRRAKLVLF